MCIKGSDVEAPRTAARSALSAVESGVFTSVWRRPSGIGNRFDVHWLLASASAAGPVECSERNLRAQSVGSHLVDGSELLIVSQRASKPIKEKTTRVPMHRI
jgi:hypothetical protein